MAYKVVEIFSSINGEGRKAGELAVFVRLAGCNLNCAYCDTMWANVENVQHTLMTKEDIYNKIKETGIKNVTLTGGEPLIHDGVEELIDYLCLDSELEIEIETNGSVDIVPFRKDNTNLSFTVDYKTGASKMEDKMYMNNYLHVNKNDVVKFVCGSISDLEKTREIINNYRLNKTTNVYISSVFGMIKPTDIVDFMKDNNMNEVKLQLQLHKYIWSPDMKGV